MKNRKNVIKEKIWLDSIPFESKQKLNPVSIELELYQNEQDEYCLVGVGYVWKSNKSDIVTCGQILDTLTPFYPQNELFKQIYSIWKEYHLNDMQAGCEHQRENWDLKSDIIYNDKSFFAGHVYYGEERFHSYSNNLIEHPKGLLKKPCEVCGYKYGTEWKHKRIPDEIVKQIKEIITLPK